MLAVIAMFQIAPDCILENSKQKLAFPSEGSFFRRISPNCTGVIPIP